MRFEGAGHDRARGDPARRLRIGSRDRRAGRDRGAPNPGGDARPGARDGGSSLRRRGRSEIRRLVRPPAERTSEQTRSGGGRRLAGRGGAGAHPVECRPVSAWVGDGCVAVRTLAHGIERRLLGRGMAAGAGPVAGEQRALGGRAAAPRPRGCRGAGGGGGGAGGGGRGGGGGSAGGAGAPREGGGEPILWILAI